MGLCALCERDWLDERVVRGWFVRWKMRKRGVGEGGGEGEGGDGGVGSEGGNTNVFASPLSSSSFSYSSSSLWPSSFFPSSSPSPFTKYDKNGLELHLREGPPLLDGEGNVNFSAKNSGGLIHPMAVYANDFLPLMLER